MLVSSLDYEQTLRNVSAVAIPELADWCAVDLLDDGRPRRVAVAPVHGGQPEAAAECATFAPRRSTPTTGCSTSCAPAARSCTGGSRPTSSPAGPPAPPSSRLMQQLGIRSVLIVPMRVPGRTIGAITFVTASSRPPPRPGDQELGEQLGRRAAVAVENARLHSRLRTSPRRWNGACCRASCRPSRAGEIASLYRPARASCGSTSAAISSSCSRPSGQLATRSSATSRARA